MPVKLIRHPGMGKTLFRSVLYLLDRELLIKHHPKIIISLRLST